MQETFNFMSNSPMLTFCVLGLALTFIYKIIVLVVFILPNRLLRYRNIQKFGYPPAHCDADGDFKNDGD